MSHHHLNLFPTTNFAASYSHKSYKDLNLQVYSDLFVIRVVLKHILGKGVRQVYLLSAEDQLPCARGRVNKHILFCSAILNPKSQS